MENQLALQNFLGIFLPPIIDMINDDVKNPKHRFLIAMAVSVGVGLFLNIDKFFPFQPEALLTNVSLVFSTATASYKLYWEKSEARDHFLDAFQEGKKTGKK